MGHEILRIDVDNSFSGINFNAVEIEEEEDVDESSVTLTDICDEDDTILVCGNLDSSSITAG